MSELDVSHDAGKSYTTLASFGDNNKCKRRAKSFLDEVVDAAKPNVRFRIFDGSEKLVFVSEPFDGAKLTWCEGNQLQRFEQPEPYVAPVEVEGPRGRMKPF